MEADVMPRFFSAALFAPALLALTPDSSQAQTQRGTSTPQTTATRTVETLIAEALIANPMTAGSPITIEPRNGKVVLRGRVGSKAVHDAIVRTAIAFGVSISDNLVIDSTVPPSVWPQASGSPPVGRIPASLLGSYTYPPSLFGRFDDPFWGLEPPPILYPPWWGELTARRVGLPQTVASTSTDATPLPLNTVEMTIDPLGVAVIRGTVPTEEDKALIAGHLPQVDGVTRIINKLTVDPTTAKPTQTVNQRPADNDIPPPLPTPSNAIPKPEPTEPGGLPIRTKAPISPPPGTANRLDRAIQARPELAGQEIKASLRDGVASLSGSVPSVYEAMLAYRSVQQTPGVKDVVDGLKFVVPDSGTSNPLLSKAKPEDVEPYLLAQIRRQVGDAAHIDRVRVGGNQLEVQGTLDRLDDRMRVEAILRSMPILRGFTILPEFRGAEG